MNIIKVRQELVMGKNTTQNNQKSVTKTAATPVAIENQQPIEVMSVITEEVNETKVHEDEIFDEVTSFLSSFVNMEAISAISANLIQALENTPGKEVLELIELYEQARTRRIETGRKLSSLISSGKAIILGQQVIPVSSNLSLTKEDNKQKEAEESNLTVLNFMGVHFATLEQNYKELLRSYVSHSEVGRWLLAIQGMNPALAAGLLTYLNVDGKQYSSQFISYCGLNDNNRPYLGKIGATKIFKLICDELKTTTVTDEFVSRFSAITQWPINVLKKTAYDGRTKTWSAEKLIAAASKYPYNAGLKSLLWKVGNCFIAQQNNPQSLYGSLFAERKAFEEQKNEAREYAEQASKIKSGLNQNDPDYRTYAAGKLPSDHITARASRWVQKIFIAHLFEEMYRVQNGHVPPRYYPLGRDPNHNKEIQPEVPYFDVGDRVYVDAVPTEVKELVNL